MLALFAHQIYIEAYVLFAILNRTLGNMFSFSVCYDISLNRSLFLSRSIFLPSSIDIYHSFIVCEIA